MARRVEVCVEDPEGAAAAEAGGADRVELCVGRAAGGWTPDRADVARACRGCSVPVHVLIRIPSAKARAGAGDFVYTDAEFATLRRQVAEAGEAGAAGVVFGVLRPGGLIDPDRTAALVALARPMAVTFHKAFDAVVDPFAALDVLADLGVARALTSGQAPSARDGLPRLAALVAHSAGRVAIMAGGGLTLADLPGLRSSGVAEVHTGSYVAPHGPTDPALVRTFADAWRRLA